MRSNSNPLNHAAKPSREGCRVSQLSQRLVGLQEGVLRRVLGQVEVAENGVGVAHGHILESAHDFVEVVGWPVLLARSAAAKWRNERVKLVNATSNEILRMGFRLMN